MRLQKALNVEQTAQTNKARQELSVHQKMGFLRPRMAEIWTFQVAQSFSGKTRISTPIESAILKMTKTMVWPHQNLKTLDWSGDANGFRQPGLTSGISALTLDWSRLRQTIAADLNLGVLILEMLKQNNEQRLWAPFLGPEGCSLRAVARYGGPHFEAFEA